MIYSIQADYQRYQVFVLDHKAVRNALGGDTQFHFARKPKSYSQDWKAFEIDFDALGSRASLIPDVSVRNGRMFFSKYAIEKVSSLIERQGEFLPVNYKGENGAFFNILSVAEECGALDSSCCIKNEYGEVQAIGFHESELDETHVFRAEFDGFMGVYCTEAFKKTIEGAGLKGVVFNADIGNVFPVAQ